VSTQTHRKQEVYELNYERFHTLPMLFQETDIELLISGGRVHGMCRLINFFPDNCTTWLLL
jgi:hypothetical protein